MKAVFLITIILISIAGIYTGIPPVPLLVLYGLLAIFPLILIFLKKDLVNGLLLWFLLILFKFGKLPLPMLPDISLDRMLWLALFLVFFSEIALKQRRLISGDMKIEIAMFLFCMLVLFSMINAGTIYVEGRGIVVSTFLSGYAIPFSIFFLGKNLVDNEDKIKKVFLFFTIIGFYLGITGVFEHFRLDYLVFPPYIMNPRVGIHWGQARGPFVQAGVNGIVLGMIFYITIYLFSRNYKKWIKNFLAISIIFILATLFFTYNRASWLGFLLSSLLIPVFFRQMRKIFIVSLLVIVLIVIFSQTVSIEKQRVEERFTAMSSIYDRINLYGAAWRMFLERPIFGFGFNTFRDVSPGYFHTIKGIPYRGHEEELSTHNTLVSILVELGLVGLSLILFIIFYTLKISISLYRRLPMGALSVKSLVVVFWGIFIVFNVGIHFREISSVYFPNALFYLLAGVIVRLNQRFQLNNPEI